MAPPRGALALLGAAAFRVPSAQACTVFAAGKGATKDGSVLVSHSDDGAPDNDARLIYVPAKDHATGSKRPIFYTPEIFPRYVGPAMGPGYLPSADTARSNVSEPIGFIDEVEHTYGYQSGSYAVLNDRGLAIGESTCGAVFGTCGKGSSVACEPGRKVGVALMSIDTLSYLAAERCASAREAVKMMGDLAVEHGFYGPPDSFEGSGESLIVGDPDEAWAFQILSDPTGTSAIWAAQRVPDTHVTVVANMYTIRVVDANDTQNFMLSPNIFDAARERGWWREGEPFDFTKMYSGGEYAHKYYSGRRMWGGFRRAAPSLHLPDEYEDIRYKPVYPWSVEPDRLVDHSDVISWHRDWYAGTKYDMTKGIQAGPFGSPDRFATYSKEVKGNWERSIALYRTNAVYVSQLRRPTLGEPQGLSSVVWYGAGAAHYAPFVPIVVGSTRSLSPLAVAAPRNASGLSMNWATRMVMNVCQIRFDKMHAMVEAAQGAMEHKGARLVADLREEYWGAGGIDAGAVNDALEQHAELVLRKWQKLKDNMLFAFSDNADMTSGAFAPLSYPASWLRASGYADGPPDAPVEDQCPPKCDGSAGDALAGLQVWSGGIARPGGTAGGPAHDGAPPNSGALAV